MGLGFADQLDFKRKHIQLAFSSLIGREAKLLAERLCSRRMRVLYTTAFSNNPVSMKYRGLLELVKRGDNKDFDASDPTSMRYVINYRGGLGQWSLDEGLSLWKQKHGSRRGRSESTQET